MKEIVREFVAKAQFNKAIDAMLAEANRLGNDELIENVLILKSQKADLDKRVSNGLIDSRDEATERNKILRSILSVLKEFNPSDLSTKPVSPPPPPTPPTASLNKILFLASNPSDSAYLQLDKEFKGVFEELQEKQDECNLFVEFAISPTKMLKKIVEKKPTIIHFSGHGMGEKTSGNEKGTRGSIVEIDVELARSGLVLQNDVTGKAQLVSTNAIANMFKTITKQFPINIVILNACYSENQAKAILQYVPYVIGMNDAVADSTAIELAKSFYNNYITNEKTVEEAFELAQAHLLLNDMPGADIPQLLCRDAK